MALSLNNGDFYKIRNCFARLCSQTPLVNLTKVSTILYTKSILTAQELCAIFSKNMTQAETAFMFYSILLAKTKYLSNVHESLHKALLEEGHVDLADVLNNSDATNINDENATINGMSLKYRKVIIRNLETISESITDPSILHIESLLIQHGIFTLTEVEEINKNYSAKTRVNHLLMILLTKSATAFNIFVQGLEEIEATNLASTFKKDLTENPENINIEQNAIKLIHQRFQLDLVNFVPVRILNNLWFKVSQPIKEFLERSSLIHALQISINSQTNYWLESKRSKTKYTVLTGPGGIGKTQAVRQYCFAHHQNSNVIWINSKNFATLRESFSSLAQNPKLGISNPESKNLDELIDSIYRADIFADYPTLLVFDDAENSIVDRSFNGIDRFLPKYANMNSTTFPINVLITSTNEIWESPTEHFEMIRVNPFTFKESNTFIGSFFNSDEEDSESVKDLINTIQGLPLALHQTVDFIKQKKNSLQNIAGSYTIQNYLKAYNEENAKILLNEKLFKRISERNHPHLAPVFLTIQLSLNQLQTENYGLDAIELLNILAYFNYYDWPTVNFLSLNPDELRLGNTLELLKKYTFVRINVTEGLLSIHSVVQDVIRIILQEQNNEIPAIRKGLKILEQKIENQDIPFLIADTNQHQYFYHALSAWDYGINYPLLIQELGPFFIRIKAFAQYIGDFNRLEKWGNFGEKSLKLNPSDPYDPGMLNLSINLLNSFFSGDTNATNQTFNTLIEASKSVQGTSSGMSESQTASKNFITSLTSDNVDVITGNSVQSLPNVIGKLRSLFENLGQSTSNEDSLTKPLFQAFSEVFNGTITQEKANKYLDDIKYEIYQNAGTSQGGIISSIIKHINQDFTHPTLSNACGKPENVEFDKPSTSSSCDYLQIIQEINRARRLFEELNKPNEALEILVDMKAKLIKFYTPSNRMAYEADLLMAEIYSNLGKDKEAYEVLQLSLQRLTEFSPDNKGPILVTLLQLVTTSKKLCKYNECRKYLNDGLRLSDEIYGENSRVSEMLKGLRIEVLQEEASLGLD